MTTTRHPSAQQLTPASAPEVRRSEPALRGLVPYAIAGMALGIILVKAEVVSWYRIQEMFRFQSFHMYGVLGSAFLTALMSIQLLTRIGARGRTGERIALPPKVLGKGFRYWIGGSIFGVGWALSGACPGPLFALVGSGLTVYVATGIAALLGTWTYGYLRPRLPH